MEAVMAEDSIAYRTCLHALAAVRDGKTLGDDFTVDGSRRFQVREGLEIGLALPGDMVDIDNQEIVAEAFHVAGAARPSWAIAACCTALIRALEHRDGGAG
jgi:hypothetical protein